MHPIRTVALAAFALLAALPAGAQTLYDGSLGSLPAAQGWTTILVGVTENLVNGAAVLKSGASNLSQGGYGWFASPLSSQGMLLQFRSKLDTESHGSLDRAGFSVIALTSSLQGIELGFWTDRVWAQNVGFTHGETGFLDTVSDFVDYDLQMGNGQYQLKANGVPVLSGALRDYSGFGAPYNTPNFLFFGDDTTSARADSRLAFVALASAPEPGALSLLALAGLSAPLLLRRRSR